MQMLQLQYTIQTVSPQEWEIKGIAQYFLFLNIYSKTPPSACGTAGHCGALCGEGSSAWAHGQIPAACRCDAPRPVQPSPADRVLRLTVDRAPQLESSQSAALTSRRRSDSCRSFSAWTACRTTIRCTTRAPAFKWLRRARDRRSPPYEKKRRVEPAVVAAV